MKKLLCALSLAYAGILFGGGPAIASQVIGVTFGTTPSSNVWSFDDQTGALTLVGAAGIRRLGSLATSPSGVLYSVGGATDDQLVTINPTTGLATTVAVLSYIGTPKPSGFISGLSFSSTGDLFAVADNTTDSGIYRINPTTGATTFVGNTGTSTVGFQDLAFSPSGTLYGWNGTQGLATINQTTGLATNIGNPNNISFNDLAFRSDGTLWAARSGGGTTWMNIDLATGAVTPTAFTFGAGGGIQGIQFLAPVPVPAAVWLFGSGMAAMGFARRMKRAG